ncbi:MAG: hypothetical protein AAF492_23785, partial [Verrucomicrobiota bacterium]
ADLRKALDSVTRERPRVRESAGSKPRKRVAFAAAGLVVLAGTAGVSAFLMTGKRPAEKNDGLNQPRKVRLVNGELMAVGTETPRKTPRVEPAGPTKAAVDVPPIALQAADARFGGPVGGIRYEGDEYGNVGYWWDLDAYCFWDVNIEHPGTWRIDLDAACRHLSGLEVSVAGERLDKELPATGDWRTYVAVEAGAVGFREPGSYRLKVHRMKDRAYREVNLKQLRLTRVGD